MYNACGLLFLSFGFTMMKFITCFSNGASLGSECHGNVIHDSFPAQSTEAPFKIEPENIIVNDSQLGTSIAVSLSGDTESFRGFMLDARKSDNDPSSGKFTLTDSINHVLICGGSAVVQSNNLLKKRVDVFWTPGETGEFFFRAAFVKEFYIFWQRKLIPVPSTTPTQTTSTVFTTTSSITSNSTVFLTSTSQTQTAWPNSEVTVEPTQLQFIPYTRCALALLLVSRLCFLGGSSLLMIIRPVSKLATMTMSVLELAFKTIAAIIMLIKLIKCNSSQIVFTALILAATVLSLMHTIIVFLYCGPSHELRKCWLCAVIVVDLMNTIITTNAVFFGILCFQESWLLILMGVYVIWEFMLYLVSVWFENKGKYPPRGALGKNENHILGKKISPWLCTFIIFSVLNVMFTAALITGVSLVKMKDL